MLRSRLRREANRLCSVAAVLAGLLLPSSSWRLHAQTTGSINGTVLDSSSAVIAGAALELTNLGTGERRTMNSSTEGYFNFIDLNSSRYALRISASGFKELRFDALQLTVGQNLTLRPALQVGAVSESVEVTAAPPPVTTSSSSVTQLVDSQRIDRLPLNGRNALQLVALVPGVVSVGAYGQFGAMQSAFRISGSRIVDSNFTLDGGFNVNQFYNNAVDYPNPDALQEFSVNTRSYSASFGRGFNQVSAITKSGTNEFHGSLFEFLRNTELDARPFFAAKRSDFKRNQFGGTFGGPVRKDKLFFFAGYQGTIVRGTPSENRYRTLNTAERNGDFSGSTTPLRDPDNPGAFFPGNLIPASRQRAFATKFNRDYLPPANSGSDFFSFAPTNKLDQKQVVAKVDYSLTEKDRVSFRYFFNDVPQRGNGVSAFLDSSWLADLPTRNQSWTLGYTRVFSPRLLNDFRLTYLRNAYGVRTTKDFSLRDLGLDVSVANAINDFGLTPDSRISVAGYFGASPGVPTRDIVPTTHLANTTSYVAGVHKLEFGVEIYHNRVNQLQNFLTAGQINFNGFASGNPAADFLLGKFSDYRQITPLVTRLRQTLPSTYVQDDIRLKRNLTVSLGVRWDPYLAWISENDVLSAYRPGVQSKKFPKMAPGLLYPGDDGLPRGVVDNRYNNFSPRLGIAWDVRGDGRTSIRAGFGVYYIPTVRAIAFNRFPLIQPFALDVRLFGGDTNAMWAPQPYNGRNPFPRPDVTDIESLRNLDFIPTAGHTTYALPFKTQSDRQWSFSIQQAVGANAAVEINYIGSSSAHMFTSNESNPAVYIPGQSTVANTQQRRLLPQFGPINDTRESLSANYNALQLVFNKRYSKGFSILSSYNWGKGLGVVGSFGEGSNGQRNPFNNRLDYGRQDNDVTHNFVTSFIWDLPGAGITQSRVLRSLAAGWQLNGINTLRSGFPFTVRSGLDNSFTGIGGDTADQVADWRLPGGRSRGEKAGAWFNPNAFTTNAIGTFGTTGINAINGPGLWTFDLGVNRVFKIGESKRFEFRGLFYNAFNYTNLGNPTNTRTSPIFGRITVTAADSRVVELGLKFAF